MTPAELLAMGRTIQRSDNLPSPYRVQEPGHLPKFAPVGRPVCLSPTVPDAVAPRMRPPDPPPDPGLVRRNDDLDDDWRLFPPEATANPFSSPAPGPVVGRGIRSRSLWTRLAETLFRGRGPAPARTQPS